MSPNQPTPASPQPGSAPAPQPAPAPPAPYVVERGSGTSIVWPAPEPQREA